MPLDGVKIAKILRILINLGALKGFAVYAHHCFFDVRLRIFLSFWLCPSGVANQLHLLNPTVCTVSFNASINFLFGLPRGLMSASPIVSVPLSISSLSFVWNRPHHFSLASLANHLACSVPLVFSLPNPIHPGHSERDTWNSKLNVEYKKLNVESKKHTKNIFNYST